MKTSAIILLLLFSLSLSANELLPCDTGQKSGIEVITFETPSYPTDTHYNGDGKVSIQLLVDNEGVVIKHTIVFSEPARLFDRSALRAARKSVFSKSREDKTRCGIISYEFILE